MKKILKAKVVASPETERTLRATANHVLFEESKHDNFWGTGLKAADPRTLDPKNWGAAIPHKKRIARKDGGNHLGKLWMQVREELPPLQN